MNPQCQSQVAFLDWEKASIPCTMFTTPYIMPGMVRGCFVIDSLLLSTLECLYSDCCWSVLNYYMNETYYALDTGVSWLNTHPLVYEPNSSRFAPNTSLNSIVNQMMIDRWSFSSSFAQYYETCAPTYCTYSDTAPTKDFVGILITLVSIISGLTVTLRIITPLFAKCAFYFLQPTIRRQRRGNHKLDASYS